MSIGINNIYVYTKKERTSYNVNDRNLGEDSSRCLLNYSHNFFIGLIYYAAI